MGNLLLRTCVGICAPNNLFLAFGRLSERRHVIGQNSADGAMWAMSSCETRPVLSWQLDLARAATPLLHTASPPPPTSLVRENLAAWCNGTSAGDLEPCGK